MYLYVKGHAGFTSSAVEAPRNRVHYSISWYSMAQFYAGSPFLGVTWKLVGLIVRAVCFFEGL